MSYDVVMPQSVVMIERVAGALVVRHLLRALQWRKGESGARPWYVPRWVLMVCSYVVQMLLLQDLQVRRLRPCRNALVLDYLPVLSMPACPRLPVFSEGLLLEKKT